MYWAKKNEQAIATEGFSAGPSTGFLENFRAAHENQRRNESSYGLEAAFSNEDNSNYNLIENLTGKKLERIPIQTYFDIAQRLEKKEPRELDENGKAFIERAEQQERELEELKKKYPAIKTRKEIWQDVKKFSGAADEELNDASERSTFLGSVGGFLGAFAGAIDPATDPYNVLTIGLGGAGRTIATRILTEAGLAGGVELINQFTGVQQNRELLGLDSSVGRSLANVGFAAAGGGAIRGGIEGGSVLKKSLQESEAVKKVFEKIKNVSKLNNKELLKEVEPINTPLARAAKDSLERETSFAESNPFGETRADIKRHNEKAQEVFEELNKRFDDIPVPEEIKPRKVIKYTDTIEFKQRFEGSKVVDEQGAPLRVYHGTNEAFDRYDIKKAGSKGDYGLSGKGIYLSGNPKTASNYGNNVRPEYVSLKNPLVLDDYNAKELADFLGVDDSILIQGENGIKVSGGQGGLFAGTFTSAVKDKGFDGVISKARQEVVAFSPDQIIPAFGEGSLQPIAPRAEVVDDVNIRDLEADSNNYPTEELPFVKISERGETIIERAINDFDSKISNEFESKWEAALNNDGKTADFGLDKPIDLDEAIPVGVKFDENGEQVVETATIRELLGDRVTEKEILEAMRVCRL